MATLLGGYGATEPEAWDGYIGFILGTGTNCCYTEQGEKIEKLPNPVGHTMVVNIEAGGYGQFPTGDFDRAVDARSNNPGEHLYEKMVSGGYFGEIALEMLQGAIQEGLLAGQAPEVLEMKAICAFLEDPGSPTPLMAFCGDPTEKEILYTLLDLLLERAAKMIAVNLTAILVQGGMGRSPPALWWKAPPSKRPPHTRKRSASICVPWPPINMGGISVSARSRTITSGVPP